MSSIPVDIVNGGSMICSKGACELTTIHAESTIPTAASIIILAALAVLALKLSKNGLQKNNCYSFDN